MKRLVEIENGKWAIKNAAAILKTAGMPKAGCLDAHRWQKFMVEEKEWIQKHGYAKQVKAWLNTSTNHDPLYNVQDDDEVMCVRAVTIQAPAPTQRGVVASGDVSPVVISDTSASSVIVPTSPPRQPESVYPQVPDSGSTISSPSTEYADMSRLEQTYLQAPPPYNTSQMTSVTSPASPTSLKSPFGEDSEDGWRCQHCGFCNTDWGRTCRRCETPWGEHAQICWREGGSPNPPDVKNKAIGSPQDMLTPVAPASERLVTRLTCEGKSEIWQIIKSDVVKHSPMALRSAAWIRKCNTAHMHTEMECSKCGTAG